MKFREIIYLFAITLPFQALSAVQVAPVHSIQDIPTTKPASGHYRLHLIDVGTGLSILIQGHDWNLLYDAGSADDKAGNLMTGDSNSRVVAYLYKAIGKSGVKSCKPAEDNWPIHTGSTQKTIDYLFLSHPHEDHGVMLDDVLECFDADNVYDSGRIRNTVFYQRFIERVSEEPGVIYRTAKTPAADNKIKVKDKIIDLSGITWQQFNDKDKVTLDNNASFTILHADGSTDEHDPNSNSIVVRLDLGDTSVLLTGDAESGDRELPSEPVDGVEKKLIDNHADLIDVDILQVGHHGSLTSSRRAFVNAVSPDFALISAGPKKYHKIVLPDAEVVESLQFQGIQVLRTDLYDGDVCPIENKVGRDDDRAGGCANFVLEW